MEDALDDQRQHTIANDMPVPSLDNGDSEAVQEEVAPKLNGDTNSDECDSEPTSEYTPTENNLKRKLLSNGNKNGCKKVKCDSDFVPPTNPYFNESLFELSGFTAGVENTPSEPKTNSNQDVQDSEDTSKSTELLPQPTQPKRLVKKKKPPTHRPQFLELQPVVQFRCQWCERVGFPSITVLKEHVKQCTALVAPKPIPVPVVPSPTTLFATRRNVYLCSACGVYYENYNLFLHLFRVHRRLICLYCAAIFSHTEKFLFHLHTKHNCVPKQLETEKDFLDTHKQPCYLMCCDCEKIFGDGGDEHFYGHACSANKFSRNSKKAGANNKSATNNKGKNKSNKGFVEHVTADMETGATNSKESNLPPTPPSVPIEIKAESVTPETAVQKDQTNLSNEDNNVPNFDEDFEPPPPPASDDNLTGTPPPLPPPDQNEDVRKVPKVTLKLRKRPPSVEHEDTNDSDKLTMELDSHLTDCNPEKENEEPSNCLEPVLNIAGSEICVTELELEQPLDKFDIQVLLQKCLQLTIPTCSYCNHARKISVNGKQLGLHAIAEHRFSAVVNSITAEELIPESFVMRIKEGLPELQNVYVSLETQSQAEGEAYFNLFECFQCKYVTTVHKELYLHNRKMHTKNVLLCIMCKSTFYNYCELICHLCPGVYDQETDLSFRCCMCDAGGFPSAFRLMVHLRKRHNTCDVCMELCQNQTRLSSHVWKHKLHHLCYRCGIAYRNKPDITKHLFWKHGTESVLCKKCLQKKWPHMYHFCMPPLAFTCDECNLNFTKAVALKVHKRLHTNEKPHSCTAENCSESFISKKLLQKHEFKHREPAETFEKENSAKESDAVDSAIVVDDPDACKDTKEEKPKPKVDVLEDLPVLNLSESDSDSEDEVTPLKSVSPKESDAVKEADEVETDKLPDAGLIAEAAPLILENIWDDFKNYQAQKEKPVSIDSLEKKEAEQEAETQQNVEVVAPEDEQVDAKEQKQIIQAIMQDHDYSLLSQAYKNDPHSTATEEPPPGMDLDHDYCFQIKKTDEQILQQLPEQPPSTAATKEEPQKDAKKEEASANSSDSDSSSCSCGPNCSCSSGSSSSSSESSDSDSSTSEGRRKQQARREQRKRQPKVKKESETSQIDVVSTDVNIQATTLLPPVELIIEETDLETTESETDEEFYDKQPHKLALKSLAEKKKELIMLGEVGTLANGCSIMEFSRPSTPSLPETETAKVKSKKSKSKKKKRKSRRRERARHRVPSNVYQYPTVSPLSILLPKNSPLSTPLMTPPILSNSDYADLTNSDSLRASKRRRIPNKFYGYSSDEEQEKLEKMEKVQHQQPVFKWRKADLPTPQPLLVPPITLKAIPPPPEQELGPVQQSFHHPHPALFKQKVSHEGHESNESTSEDEHGIPTMNKPLNQPPLYCYCRCPYDEVSEMIGCDADDCVIEWFHFECVGIMVPPKGQWFCPDCRKKKQLQREMAQL